MNDKFSKIKKKQSFDIEIKKINIDDDIIIDFSYFYFPCIKTKTFTIFFKDEEFYYKYMSSFYNRVLPNLIFKKYSELEKNKHNHTIGKEELVKKIRNILDTYKNTYDFLPDIADESKDEFYQLVGQGGMRMIGFRNSNKFNLLFLDPYHLIYKDPKHNKDEEKYKYQIVECNITDHLNIFDINSLFESEECLECEILEKIISNNF